LPGKHPLLKCLKQGRQLSYPNAAAPGRLAAQARRHAYGPR
jgi:hypothetical protein